MWQFPMREESDADAQLSDYLGLHVQSLEEPIYELRHQFTHMNIKVYIVYLRHMTFR